MRLGWPLGVLQALRVAFRGRPEGPGGILDRGPQPLVRDLGWGMWWFGLVPCIGAAGAAPMQSIGSNHLRLHAVALLVQGRGLASSAGS